MRTVRRQVSSGRISRGGHREIWAWLAGGALLVAYLLQQFAYLYSPGLCEGAFGFEFAASEMLDLFQRHALLDLLTTGYMPASRESYHSMLPAYLFLPFLKLFGPSWFLVRAWPVAVGAVALIFTFLWIKELFGNKAAVAVLFLLNLHPTFLLNVKLGSRAETPMFLFAAGALYFLALWWKKPDTWRLAAGTFILGLGSSSLLWFHWLNAGLIVIAFWFRKDLLKRLDLNRQGLKIVAYAGVAYCAGAIVTIYRELFQGFPGMRRIVSGLWLPSGGHDNRNYFDNLLAVFHSFNEMLASPGGVANGFPFAAQFGNWGFPWIFWCSYLGLVGLVIKKVPLGRSVHFLIGLFALMFLQTPISPSDIPHVHLLFFYPLPQVVIAVAALTAFKLFWRNPVGGRVCLAVCAIVVLSETRGLANYYSHLSAGRFSPLYTNAIYGLRDWLLNDAATSRVLTVRQNIHRNLYFLLGSENERLRNLGALCIGGPAERESRGIFRAMLEDRASPALLVVAGWPLGEGDLTKQTEENCLAESLRTEGMELRLAREISDRSGRVDFWIYKVESKQGKKYAALTGRM